MLSTTTRYYYDGVNEIVETDGSGNRLRYYVHGISYVDERLMMLDYKDTGNSTDDRPYYFTIDRMYNVRMVVDRAGAIVERYAYDPYGRPLIREAPARGDMDNDNLVDSADQTRFDGVRTGSLWDPRADMDDDGDVDSGRFAQDAQLFSTKHLTGWPPFMPFPPPPNPTVAQAFSDVNNPFMFQGRPHFALDTGASDTVAELMINDHRARMNDPVTGRWVTRDPEDYNPWLRKPKSRSSQYADGSNIYQFLRSRVSVLRDPSGLYSSWGCPCACGWQLCVAAKCAVYPCSPMLTVVARLLECQTMGLEAAINWVNGGGDINMDEGIRHCVASGCLARAGGTECAKCIGEVREDFQAKCDGQSQQNTDRANYNNGVGRSCADRNAIPPPTMAEIITCCRTRAERGDLWGSDENAPPNPAD